MFARDKSKITYSSMLHISKPDAENKPKIVSFVEKLFEKFEGAFYPYLNVCVSTRLLLGGKVDLAEAVQCKLVPKYHIKTFGF